MGLLRAIFILILVWYVMKLIIRYILPKAFFHFLNKRGFATNESRQKKPKEGEINIKMEHPPKSKKDDNDFGEYVDFEEVKPEQKPENEE